MGFVLTLASTAFGPAARSSAEVGTDSRSQAATVAAARTTPTATTSVASSRSGGSSAPADLRSDVADPEYLALAEFTPRRRAYVRMRHALALAEPFVDAGIAALLFVSGLAARAREAVRRASRGRYLQTLAVVTVLTLAAGALALPLAAFRDFYWEHRYGLSTQTLVAWLGEYAESLLIAIGLFGVTGVVALGLWIVERAGRHAWLVLAALTGPLLAAAVLVAPVVIEPVFNRFEPLRDARLAQRIVALATRAGVPARQVVQVDCSRQTRTINAYVSGFGPSQRVVIWDTTLRALREDELLFVVAHELGHYRLRHILQGILAFTAGSFALYFATDRLSRRVLARWGARGRVTSLADPAALPAIAAVVCLLGVPAAPIANAFSRRVEHQADTFALELTHANAAAVRAYLAMGRLNQSDPNPPRWLEWVLYTHPPLLARIRFAERYHPWSEGRPNRFAP